MHFFKKSKKLSKKLKKSIKNPFLNCFFKNILFFQKNKGQNDPYFYYIEPDIIG